MILFSPRTNSEVYRIPANGGTATAVTHFDKGRQETAHRHPYFLPDGHHFLYRCEPAGICLASLEAPDGKLLLPSDSNAIYAPPGFVLFLRQTNLMAQHFDSAKLELEGDAFVVADHVGMNSFSRRGLFTASQHGELVFQTQGESGNRYVLLDRSGKQLAQGESGTYFGLRLSPDGKRLAVFTPDSTAAHADLWLHDFTAGVRTRFTFDDYWNHDPIWSPDGTLIAFASIRKGHNDIYVKRSDGTGTEDLLYQSDDQKYTVDWSRDGRFLLYVQAGTPGQSKLWALPMQGAKQPITLIGGAFDINFSVFSPDTHWIAYQSNETGINQVYVTSFPDARGKWQVSADGGLEPKWRGDGKEIFFVSGDRIMSTDVNVEGGSIRFSSPKVLLASAQASPVSGRYDVSADGKLFAIAQPAEDNPALRLIIRWAGSQK